MKKLCKLCGQYKDVSEFGKNSRNKDGLHSYCKECNAKKAKEYNKTEKGKINVKRALKRQQESGYFKYGKGAIDNMSRSAQKRHIEFSLTEVTLKKWWMSTPDKCAYCEISIEEYRKLRDYVIAYQGDNWEINRFKRFFALNNHAQINDMTIDRVDNSRGYEISNIVKSCWFCNSLKSDFYTGEEMRVVGKQIIKDLKKLYEECGKNE